MQATNEISAREAAKRLGVGLSHLYQLLWTGKISAQKRDGAWRIPGDAIEARLRTKLAGETERGDISENEK
jgi:excisionase family DNA binding protein